MLYVKKFIIEIFYISVLYCGLSILPSYAITLEDWQEITSWGNRDEGNSAELLLVQWLLRYGQEHMLNVQRRDLSPLPGGMHSFAYNVDFYFPGENSAEFVFLIPQSHYDASLLLGLTLLDQLRQEIQIPYSMRVIFLSGEQRPSDLIAYAAERQSLYPLGTQQILRLGIVNIHSYLFYYQIEQPTNTYYIGTKQYMRSPLSIVNVVRDLADNLDWQISLSQSNVIPRDLNPRYAHPTDFYLGSEYSAISIVGTGEENLSPPDWLAWSRKQASGIIHQAKSVSEISDAYEINYLIIFNRIIREKTYLLVMLFISFIFLIIASVKRHQFRSQWRYLRQKGKAVWLLLPLVYISLFLSTFITYQVNTFNVNMDLVPAQALLLFGYKALWTLFLFALLGRLFEGLQLGSRKKFYTISALVLALIALFVFSIINVVYALAWVWFLTFYMLYVLIKQWHLRFIFTLLAPLAVIYFMQDYFLQNTRQDTEFFLFNATIGNFLLLLTFSPSLMLGMSLFRQRRVIRMHRFPPYSNFIFYIVMIFFTTFLLRYDRIDEKVQKQSVWLLAEEEIIGRRSLANLRVWSGRNLGDIRIVNHQTTDEIRLVSVPTMMVSTIPIKSLGRDFRIAISFEEVLSRTLTIIDLGGLDQAQYVDVMILSDRNFSGIDANFPFFAENARKIRLHLGKNPPENIQIRLISNDPLRIEARVTASYNMTDVWSVERNNSILKEAYGHLVKIRTRSVLEI
ncbi:hypothetical protein PVA44_04390 [Entomospira nematocerorum]|uniref:Uncharacterized protein n=1 Tax=Entomospira nematocerorum TaxID=2719987 RepID=A0A968GFC3_9SPIO|nr:hypothetical protein [Entomospira nematocera]NIZ46736.1 hypothetical protein [Entomospira nematocera]WDI33468.1 hypothetical protein PVA44_04390 [Entomospira nematocera]